MNNSAQIAHPVLRATHSSLFFGFMLTVLAHTYIRNAGIDSASIAVPLMYIGALVLAGIEFAVSYRTQMKQIANGGAPRLLFGMNARTASWLSMLGAMAYTFFIVTDIQYQFTPRAEWMVWQAMGIASIPAVLVGMVLYFRFVRAAGGEGATQAPARHAE